MEVLTTEQPGPAFHALLATSMAPSITQTQSKATTVSFVYRFAHKLSFKHAPNGRFLHPAWYVRNVRMISASTHDKKDRHLQSCSQFPVKMTSSFNNDDLNKI